MKLKTYINKFNKSSIWFKIVIIGIICLLIKIVFYNKSVRKESFITSNEQFVYHTGDAIYDDFYATIYDILVYNKGKNEFEIEQIEEETNLTRDSYILDIGSGLGHHIKLMNKKGYNATGLEKSHAMLKSAREKYPDGQYDYGDALDGMLYSGSTFTHITCFYFTVYYIKDKETFFRNCYKWLMPGGYLIVHLVDRVNFSPILEVGDQLSLISPQKYAKKRITSTYVKFDDYDYKSNFRLNEKQDKAYMDEYFVDKTKEKALKNEHKLFMPSQKTILSIAKQCGFIVLSKVDMVEIEYEYQYLYILQKPS